MRDHARYYLAYGRNWMREWRRRAGARARQVTFIDNVCRRWFEWRHPVDVRDPLNRRMRQFRRVW